MDLKNHRRGRIKEYAEKYTGATYLDGERPWSVKCDVALPCATENEIDGDDARILIDNGCFCVGEGANMPSDPDAVNRYLDAGILYTIMKDIHSTCVEHGQEGDYVIYVNGANVAGFIKVADAMLDQGVV